MRNAVAGGATCLALAVLCSSASAGLIFDLDGGIDAHGVKSIEVRSDRVTIALSGSVQIIKLPEGMGDDLVAWARRDTGGPVIVSMDGAFVSQADSYAPPSVPRELVAQFLSYDVYAHGVACGGTLRDGAESHPLVHAQGGRRLPHEMHDALLSTSNLTPAGFAYRKLPERFARPFTCIGELALHAVPGSKGKLVAVQPRAWLHALSDQWHRIIDVASDADKWIARLPYQPLKEDMESRWPAYRAAFPPLSSLSSAVEAMAALRAIKRDAPEVWRELERSELEPVPLYERFPSIQGYAWSDEAWEARSLAWLGEKVETPVEANLAIALAVMGRLNRGLMTGVFEVAERDRPTAYKLSLVAARFARDSAEEGQRARRALAELSEDPGMFRLRVHLLAQLERALPEEERAASWRALAADFQRDAERACASGSTDAVLWEDLTQNVYSVGLIGRLRDEHLLTPRVLSAIACIHYHRGMAPQRGRELAYQHAHFRFLGYLSRLTWDAAVLRQINRYRRELARTMNLRDAELEQEGQS